MAVTVEYDFEQKRNSPGMKLPPKEKKPLFDLPTVGGVLAVIALIVGGIITTQYVTSGPVAEDNSEFTPPPPPEIRDLALLPDRELGKLRWKDEPETLFQRVRFGFTRRTMQGGVAVIYLRAPDGLWRGSYVRIGERIDIDGGDLIVRRIDEHMVLVVPEADKQKPIEEKEIHRLFQPVDWDRVRQQYGFSGRPFSERTLAIARSSVWNWPFGSRRVLGEHIRGLDYKDVPPDLMRQMVPAFTDFIVEFENRQRDADGSLDVRQELIKFVDDRSLPVRVMRWDRVDPGGDPEDPDDPEDDDTEDMDDMDENDG